MNLYESIKSNLKEDDILYNNSENANITDGDNLTFDDIYISCRLTGQNKGLLGVAYVKDPSDDKIYNVEVSYIDGEYRATSGLYPSERLVNLMKSIYGEHIEDFAKDVVKKEGIELNESELKEADEYDEYRAKLTEKAKTIEKLLKTYNSDAKVDVFVDPTDEERPRVISLRSGRFPAESISRYENDIAFDGNIAFDENLNVVATDIKTSSGPNLLNQDFINALNALYTFVKSNGDHWDA